MANYTLVPPIDTTQINLYPSGGGSFAVNIRGSSSLATNTTFPLPSTTGNTGDFLTYNGSGTSWVPINQQLPINISFYEGRLSSTTSSTFEVLGEIYFQGTNFITPSAINAIISGSSATNVQVQINDSTNPPNIIGTSSPVNTTSSFQIVSIPITGTLSSGPAIWDIQLRRSSNVAQIRGLQILP
jgi:hypothetical protein